MEEWKTYKIKDISKVNLSQYSLKEGWEEIAYLDTGSITENRIDSIQTFILPCDDFPSRARRKVRHNDILFSTVRPNQRHYGILKNPPENLLVSTGFAVITVDPALADADFVYFYLTQTELIDFLQGVAEQSVSAYPSLKSSDIEDLEIVLPSLAEQKRIASILSSLDNKIALNVRINHNLEEQVQDRFNALIAGDNGAGYCQLSDIIDVNPTRKLSKNAIARCVEMSYLSTNGSFPLGWEFKAYNGGMKFINGDTIMARITPCLENGKVAYVNFLDSNEVGFGSTEYIVLRSKEGVPMELSYFLARNPEFVEYAVKNMNGSSGRQRVSGDSIAKYIIPVMTSDSIQSFSKIARASMAIIRKNCFENRSLVQTRDTLLSALMRCELLYNN